MLMTRVIPCLLIENKKLVKTTQFRNPKYIGDPINAIKIYNEKEVDEIILLDITRNKSSPEFEYISKIASECFMPLCYGGGISSKEDVYKIIDSGVEKVSINTNIRDDFVKDVVKDIGSQSVVASVDVRNTQRYLYSIYIRNGMEHFSDSISLHINHIKSVGCGEILLTNIYHEGMMNGYDTKLISMVSHMVDIPVVAHGGSGNISHLEEAIQHGASACAIGSMAVYHNKNKSVLINFPSREELKNII